MKYLPLRKRQRVGMGLEVKLRKGVASLPAIGITKIVPIGREKRYLQVGKVIG